MSGAEQTRGHHAARAPRRHPRRRQQVVEPGRGRWPTRTAACIRDRAAAWRPDHAGDAEAVVLSAAHAANQAPMARRRRLARTPSIRHHSRRRQSRVARVGRRMEQRHAHRHCRRGGAVRRSTQSCRARTGAAVGIGPPGARVPSGTISSCALTVHRDSAPTRACQQAGTSAAARQPSPVRRNARAPSTAPPTPVRASRCARPRRSSRPPRQRARRRLRQREQRLSTGGRVSTDPGLGQGAMVHPPRAARRPASACATVQTSAAGPASNGPQGRGARRRGARRAPGPREQITTARAERRPARIHARLGCARPARRSQHPARLTAAPH